MAKLVAIHQPNYLPWLGYFHKIARADLFVFLDDVQFSKGGYTNRVRILREGRAAWLTQPVRRGLGQPIEAVRFARDDWPARHLDALKGAYRRAPRFAEVWPDLVAMYEIAPAASLAEVNRRLVRAVAERLDLACEFVSSRDAGLGPLTGDDRLIALVENLAPGASYLSGQGGAGYQDPAKFEAAGIGLCLDAFRHPEYPQGRGPFRPGLSVVDAVFHLGWLGAGALVRGA